MGIYIKDMEMPKTCFECPFMFARRYCCASLTLDLYQGDYDEIKGRVDGCPLVPFHPHVGVIEKNAVFELIRSFPNVDSQLPVEFMRALYNLPSIIFEDDVPQTPN